MYMTNGYIEVQLAVIGSNGSIMRDLNSNHVISLPSKFHSDLTKTRGDRVRNVKFTWKYDSCTHCYVHVYC